MRRLNRSVWLFLLCLLLGALPPASWGSGLTTGKPAPNFLVESGDDQELSRHMILGKVIVLFYESKNVTKKNIELKKALTRLYHSQPANVRRDIFRLVVIDCSEASVVTSPIWKYKLREGSRKEGFTIYGDWTRRMLKDYQMKSDESNFLIIDRQGIIRFSAAGKIADSQFGKIKDMLFSLVQEGQMASSQ